MLNNISAKRLMDFLSKIHEFTGKGRNCSLRISEWAETQQLIEQITKRALDNGTQMWEQ